MCFFLIFYILHLSLLSLCEIAEHQCLCLILSRLCGIHSKALRVCDADPIMSPYGRRCSCYKALDSRTYKVANFRLYSYDYYMALYVLDRGMWV